MSEPDNVVALSVNNLTKRFGADVVALDQVSFTLRQSEVVAIIGSSGSGKSTLLRCIDLLEEIDEGVIEYAGGMRLEAILGHSPVVLDMRSGSALAMGLSTLRIRRSLGFVFQGYDLWEEKTVLENLVLAPIVVAKDSREIAETKAIELCQRFGLYDKLQARAWQLSGGQRQRVAIIRALMMRPELLLLDEITSSLDPLLTCEVMALIRELKGDGMTMLLVTHHLHFACAVSDRIIFLHAGHILQQAPPRELVESPATPEVTKYLGVLNAIG